MTENLISLIERRPGVRDRPLIETPDGRCWTYRDVLDLAGRLAGALLASGARRGDRIAAQIDKSPEGFALYLGCLRAGLVFLPLNPAYTSAELDYFLGDAEPAVFVVRPEQERALAPLAAGIGAKIMTLGTAGEGSLPATASKATVPADENPGRDDIAAILYTSGTTGRAKGAMLTHGNLASNAMTLAETWRFAEHDVLLHALPIFHAHGLFVAANTVMVAGASMLFLPKFDLDVVMRLLPRATTMMGVPTFYTRLLGDPRLDRGVCANMRLFVSGSAPLLAETHRAWQARSGHAILERYGMTETVITTSNPYDGDRVAGTVGFPLPGVELRIVDPASGQALPRGETGMIEVRGPTVFPGYWRQPERNKAEFRSDGFFITGDLARRDDRGYLHIVGRDKDLVISGGYNVYPKEVESEIDGLPGVVESAVFGVAHPDFGEGVTAAVVVQPGQVLEEIEVLKALEARLARYKLPKRVIVVTDLPRNAMGKVQKNVLRQTYGDLYRRLAG
ncbi:MAG: malonyl-CoA synthase [Alphaproteobacteria bacterium]|nr:malonyl-CoA synthase [Alphaproteobacteria bacterium]